MKIIDLLNKIANGEEVKFRLINDDLTYSLKKNNYLHIEELNKDAEWYIDKSWLNEEVEIIEEENKIEKSNIDTSKLKGKEVPRAIDYLLESKINEIIDKLNKGE